MDYYWDKPLPAKGKFMATLKQNRNTFSTHFSPKKFRDIAKKGSVITAEKIERESITRNISSF